MEGFWLSNHLPLLFHRCIFKKIQSQVLLLLQASAQQCVQSKTR